MLFLLSFALPGFEPSITLRLERGVPGQRGRAMIQSDKAL